MCGNRTVQHEAPVADLQTDIAESAVNLARHITDRDFPSEVLFPVVGGGHQLNRSKNNLLAIGSQERYRVVLLRFLKYQFGNQFAAELTLEHRALRRDAGVNDKRIAGSADCHNAVDKSQIASEEGNRVSGRQFAVVTGNHQACTFRFKIVIGNYLYFIRQNNHEIRKLKVGKRVAELAAINYFRRCRKHVGSFGFRDLFFRHETATDKRKPTLLNSYLRVILMNHCASIAVCIILRFFLNAETIVQGLCRKLTGYHSGRLKIIPCLDIDHAVFDGNHNGVIIIRAFQYIGEIDIRIFVRADVHTE